MVGAVRSMKLQAVVAALVARKFVCGKKGAPAAEVAAWLRYRRFCNKDFWVDPESEAVALVLPEFLVFLTLVVHPPVLPATAKRYADAIVRLHVVAGIQLRQATRGLSDVTNYVYRDLESWKPQGQRTKFPITLDQLGIIMDMPDSEADCAVKAAVLLAFAGLLRGSEYVKTSKKPRPGLRRRDVRFVTSTEAGDCVILHIFGKTDDPHHGGDVVIGTGATPRLDPVRRLRLLYDALEARRPGLGPDDAVFIHPSSGRYVTAQEINAVLKLAVRRSGHDPDLYASHSLRIGGATAMAAAGRSTEEIMIAGRWKSTSSFMMYIRHTVARLAAVTRDITVRAADVLRRGGRHY